jgi:hypothetical protein
MHRLRLSVFELSAKPKIFTYETNLQFPTSDYKANTSNAITQDFVNTQNERVYRPRGRIESGDPAFPDMHAPQYWQSTYQATILNSARALEQPHPQLQAKIELYESAVASKVVATDLGRSVNKTDFGVYGSNPRTRFNPNSVKITSEKTDLTLGTTKGTGYIPGYQGHIPINSRNPYKARYEQRNYDYQPDKSNICQNFKRNMHGYGGYQFLNPLNDKGSVQISSATTYGEANSVQNWTM